MTPNATGADAVIDAVTAVLLIVGALMSLGAAIGLLRFPDLMSRMHAATKPQVLGLFLVLAGVGLQMRTWWVWPVLLVVWIFQLLTVPVSARQTPRAGPARPARTAVTAGCHSRGLPWVAYSISAAPTTTVRPKASAAATTA